MDAQLLLVAHAGSTLAMVGVMWAVQLVVYPQFRSVPAESFSSYVSDHSARIVLVLIPFAPAEVVLALLLVVIRPGGVPVALLWVAGALLAAAWVATGLWYAPLHGRLQRDGYNGEEIERLIRTNWVRTGLWSARGLLALSFLL
jgi:hypothetical protein